MTTRVIEGSLVASKGLKVAIVASRFNHIVVDRLVEGAIDALVRHGVEAGHVTVIRVPGAWELPFVVRRLAASNKVDAIVALGAVVRGDTPHFDYVAGEAARGIAAAAHASSTPIVFGVLTTETMEQAIERAGAKAGNKGWDAAVSAIEMVALRRGLDDAGL